MPVDRLKLFESTNALWPETVDISATDALNRIYRSKEKSFSVNDDWRQIALWAFHQSLAELEQQRGADRGSVISPHKVEFSTFDKWMRFNLEGDDCWKDERLEWVNID